MKKYLTVFGISFQNEFTYRLNFVLWRFRNVLRILMTFFLWNSIFSQNIQAFGYSRPEIMAYIFAVLLISTFVIAAPSNDNVGGEIGSGDLSNYLVKPINYLQYWLTRDWASKLLNMLFAVFEIGLLYVLFKPQLAFSSSPALIIGGLLACLLAALIYFLVTKLAVFVAFWIPENTWGLMFFFLVLFEMLSGSIFPLDVLPSWGVTLLKFTPFPYLVYYPIGILVGKFDVAQMGWIIAQSAIWLGISFWLVSKVWKAGLKVYSAVGR